MLFSGKKSLRAGIAAILVLVLLFSCSLAGCSPKIESPVGSTPSATTPPPATTEPSTTTQPPETTDPPEPQPSVDIVVEEAILTYEMTEADVAEFYTLLTECEDLSLNSTDVAAVETSVEKLDAKYAYLEEQFSIAMILYYCDLTDEAASQLYLDCTDTVTQANNDYLMMARRIYLSDSPHKDTLFEDWTDEDFAFLMAYTEEVMQLRQRNSEIEVAYQDLQNSPTMYDKMVPLFIEMVQNNNRIAQIYGYNNYYEYAYEQVYSRDYDHDNILTMRSYVSQYLAPSLSGALEKFNTSMGKLSIRGQQSLVSFLYDSYTTNGESYINHYLATLPEQMQTDMLDMFNGNIVTKDSASGAQEGAFTTTIGEDRLICYFGPGYSSAMTIVHEVGHYYGGCHTYLNDLPLDLAETQSQGNEWLFLSYLKNDLSSGLYQSLVDYRMYSDIANVLICVIVDEFEERVYTHSDIASLTSADLDAIMEDVCQAYGGINDITTNITNIQNYWRMVVIEQPVYYISYGVSGLAAMDLYTVATEDYDKAVDIYRRLIEEVDTEQGFLGNISAAGISGPFDEEFYKELYAMFTN